MSGYLLGLATLPLGVAVLGLVFVIVKGSYIAAGRIGRVGIIRYGKRAAEERYTAGAAVASAGHIVLLNRNDTGVVFFTGRARDDVSHLSRLSAALRDADRTSA